MTTQQLHRTLQASAHEASPLEASPLEASAHEASAHEASALEASALEVSALGVFAEYQRCLLSLLQRHRAVAAALDSSVLTGAVAALEEQAAGAAFQILVLGESARDGAALAAAIRNSGWPARAGADVTDSPGIGETSIRAQLADGRLAAADAIIFMVDATAPFSAAELCYLQDLVLPLAHEDIFFVCGPLGGNTAGTERASAEAVAFQRVSRLHIGGLGQTDGTLWDPRVFVVDDAGLSWFDEALQRFLARDKGRVKLLIPVREMRARLREARILLREQAVLRDQDPGALATRSEDAGPELDLLDQRGKVMAAGLADDITAVEMTAGQMTRDVLVALSAREPGSRPQALLGWQNDTLCPWLRRRLTAIENTLNADLDVFLGEVRRLRATLTGSAVAFPRGAGISPLDELLSGGDQPGDTPIDVAGARTGANAVLGSVLPHVGVLIAGLLPALGGPLDAAAPGLAQGFAQQLGGELRAVAGRVERDLGGQTCTVREIARAGIRAARQGPAAAPGGDRLAELAAEIERLESERAALEERISAL